MDIIKVIHLPVLCLKKFFQGVSIVLTISGINFGQLLTQHGTVAEVAKKSDVSSIIERNT